MGDLLVAYESERLCGIEDLRPRTEAPGTSERTIRLRRGGEEIEARVPPGRIGVELDYPDSDIADVALRDELVRLADVLRQRLSGRTGEWHRPAPEPEPELERLREIVRARGWPGFSLVGRRGSGAAFSLVLSARDQEFRQKCTRRAEAAFERGEVDGIELAFLTDLARLDQGRLQVYGSVWSPGAPIEVEDPRRVEGRLRRVGLHPLASELGERGLPPLREADDPRLRDEILRWRPEVEAEFRDLRPFARQQERMRRLREIIDRHGWPGYSLVGPTASRTAASVAQQTGDPFFIRYCLGHLEEAVRRGDADSLGVDAMRESIERFGQMHGVRVQDGGVPEAEVWHPRTRRTIWMEPVQVPDAGSPPDAGP